MYLCGVIYKLRLKVHVPQHVVCSDSTSPPSHGGDEQRSFSQVSPSIILHPPVAWTGINTHIAQVGPFGEQASRGLKVIKWAMVVIAEYARVQLLSRERHMKIGSLKKKRKRKKILTSWKRYYMSWPSLCFLYLYTSFTAFSKTLVFLHLLIYCFVVVVIFCFQPLISRIVSSCIILSMAGISFCYVLMNMIIINTAWMLMAINAEKNSWITIVPEK